ncbi:MEDS domain-containing protein [Streptomyces zagrosensis]|uniref:Anti-anti-sigma regulatory factor n=1 Tax=Streptomyces zagrosensis TaxID=1042984 RepID=A0A7W9UYI3_9ACTN|nr:MEDS domain-containing protein [Streptomyces zagrosensis]MBB5935371.1 anti-anti-sigma regulatory factor [Streptomyces zagrosensis]
MSYEDGDSRAQIMAAFVWLGVARGEKVTVFADPALSEQEVRDAVQARGPSVAPALNRGQLEFSSMRALLSPDHEFTVGRQHARLTEETEHALRQGYTGFRAFIDMAWVRDLGADIAVMIRRETHSAHLFTGRPYSEICAYDRRWFAGDVLDHMAKSHPYQLLDRLGVLNIVESDDTLLVIGEADISGRARFTDGVRAALTRTERAALLTIDLSRLHFLSLGCATDLLALTLAATTRPQIAVACDPYVARTLRRLGSDSISKLALIEVSRQC